MAKREFIEKERIKDVLHRYFIGNIDCNPLIDSQPTFTEQDIVKPYLDKMKEKIEPYVYENKYEDCIKEDMTGWICASDVLRLINNLLSEQGDSE